MSDPNEQLFAAYPSEVQAVATKLRRMITGVMPQARERIYHGAVSYSLGPSGRDWIVYLALLKDYVRLGFYYGGYLADPHRMLEGEGKRMRHVKVRTLKEASQPALRELVRAARANGTAQLARMKQERREQRTSR